MERIYLTILGSTGSVGQASLKAYETLRAVSNDFQIQLFALVAAQNTEELWRQILRYQPCYAVLTDPDRAKDLAGRVEAYRIGKQCRTEILVGLDAAIWACQNEKADVVIAAASGHATFSAILAAIEANKKILLANKESLVLGGECLLKKTAQSTATIIPIDSEHNAIFQCLTPLLQSQVGKGKNLAELGVAKIGLLATGGPFWGFSNDALGKVTPEMACRHPVWQMGKKISVDCATLMNKALEYIEAAYLFGLPQEAIELQLHRSGQLHGWVRYRDGHWLLHGSPPDMSLGIAYALSYPSRNHAYAQFTDPGSKDWSGMLLEPLCKQKHTAVRLACEALHSGFWAPIVLNAVNDCAVQAFLEKKLSFQSIIPFCEQALEKFSSYHWPQDSIRTRLAIDRLAREYCHTQWPKPN